MSATVYDLSIELLRPSFLGGGKWELHSLLPITIIFGKNGSGKSLLLRQWRDLDVRGSHYVVPERTGNINYDPNYMRFEGSPEQRKERSSSNFISEYRQHIIARIYSYHSARSTARGGEILERIEDLEQLISMLMPEFEFRFSGNNEMPYELKRIGSQQNILNAQEISSGEAQLLTLGLDILIIASMWSIQSSKRRLMLIDEPDTHMHPDLQARFADFLVKVADRYNLQIVLATHSTTLLSALGHFADSNCGVVYIDRSKSSFQTQKFTAALKETAAYLGGHALMGPLFGVPILLVEGDDDYRVWSQVPRVPPQLVNFAVIPCDGGAIRSYQKSLEGVFASIRESGSGYAGYALQDGDVRDANRTVRKLKPTYTENHIKYLVMNCHEIENLYLTDEVLALLEHTWESAKEIIIAASSARGSKKLAEADSWDRQWGDFKKLIDRISQALDPNKHWTRRLAEAIGRKKPEGQLAEFLGEDVIKHLWRGI